MKKLLLILLLAGCQKEGPTCKICDENVNYQTLGNSQYYIQSSTEYCDESWQDIDGQVTKASGTNQGAWYKKTTTITCHDK